jgi:hypothetical protein
MEFIIGMLGLLALPTYLIWLWNHERAKSKLKLIASSDREIVQWQHEKRVLEDWRAAIMEDEARKLGWRNVVLSR